MDSQNISGGLGDLVSAELEKRGWPLAEFTRRLAKLKGVEWYPGLSGPVSTILAGKKGLPADQMDVWAKVLGWKSGTPEYHAFYDAAMRQRARLSTKGENKGGAGNYLEAKIKVLESENAKLREENQRLRAELEASGSNKKKPARG